MKKFWLLRKRIIAKEGGEKTSKTLRDFTKQEYLVEVGMYTYGSCFEKTFNIGGKVSIGNYCSFASNVHYFGGNHPMEYASMSPYFYNKSFGMDVKDIPRGHLIIGNDVWCGFNALITNKCQKIGDGAVIAAGAVVTRDVPPYAVVGGNPAKIIRYRFDKETIELLKKSKWYEMQPDELMEYYSDIDNPKMFCKRIMYAKGEF